MKFNIVLATMLKDEASYLDEWLGYYLNLGVEHFYIYDNGSSDGLSKVLIKYINAGLVTSLFWPKQYGQIDAFNHAWSTLIGKTEWLGFFDVDEFLCLKSSSNILDFLTKLNADQVLIPWKNFGYCGHKNRPEGLVIENYRFAYKNDKVLVKHFFKPEKISLAGIHSSVPLENSVIKMENGSISGHTHACENPSYLNAQINHYQTKSYQEFSDRINKGEAAHFVNKTLLPFHDSNPANNPNLYLEVEILKNINKIKEAINYYENLPENPHRYGLKQKIAFFPSANSVLLNFITALGNYLLKLKEPARATNYIFLYEKDSEIVPFQLFWADKKSELKLIVKENINWDEFTNSIHFKIWCNFYSAFKPDPKRYQDYKNAFFVIAKNINSNSLNLDKFHILLMYKDVKDSFSEIEVEFSESQNSQMIVFLE